MTVYITLNNVKYPNECVEQSDRICNEPHVRELHFCNHSVVILYGEPRNIVNVPNRCVNVITPLDAKKWCGVEFIGIISTNVNTASAVYGKNIPWFYPEQKYEEIKASLTERYILFIGKLGRALPADIRREIWKYTCTVSSVPMLPLPWGDPAPSHAVDLKIIKVIVAISVMVFIAALLAGTVFVSTHSDSV